MTKGSKSTTSMLITKTISTFELTSQIKVKLEKFSKHKPQRVVHLAAQAGVRHSLENPMAYIESNIVGFSYVWNCRHYGSNTWFMLVVPAFMVQIPFHFR